MLCGALASNLAKDLLFEDTSCVSPPIQIESAQPQASCQMTLKCHDPLSVQAYKHGRQSAGCDDRFSPLHPLLTILLDFT